MYVTRKTAVFLFVGLAAVVTIGLTVGREGLRHVDCMRGEACALVVGRTFGGAAEPGGFCTPGWGVCDSPPALTAAAIISSVAPALLSASTNRGKQSGECHRTSPRIPTGCYSCRHGGSAMTHHPHVHMIVPGGGISLDGSRWISSAQDYLLPVPTGASLSVLRRPHGDHRDGGAHLERVDLTEAHLEGAFPVGAHLEGANILDAHLERVRLIGAHLESASPLRYVTSTIQRSGT
jgi:hypothetical protein